MKRLVAVALALTLGACAGPPPPLLVMMPDGKPAYTVRANSGPFMVGKITEEQVVQDYVRGSDLCSGPVEILNVQREHPENYSLVIVSAIIRCQGDTPGRPSEKL